MDSTWFAVDEDGHIAFFDTGEGGAMPEAGFPAAPAGGELDEYWILARALWSRAQTDDRLRAMLPSSLRGVEKLVEKSGQWELIPVLLRSLGVFTYSCDEGSAVAYARDGAVPHPMPVDRLDGETREKLRGAKLPVRFADAPAVAPGEFVPVVSWDSIWFDTEGRVHPASGAEGKFRLEAERLEALDPEDFLVEALDGESFEGEALYGAVERMVRGIDRDTDFDDDPAGGSKVSWWRRLLGLD